MREIFLSLWKMAGGKNGARVYADLEKRYTEKKRYYHNLHHIENALCYSNMGKNILALELAIFYHDAIYDVERQDNEEESAKYFRKTALESGLGEALIKNVEELILATKHLKKPKDFDSQLICDIDLSEMGKSYKVFSANNDLVRKEFSIYDDKAYDKGRREFMTKILDRPEIYYTDEFRKYEKIARENIERYLSE